MSVRTANRRPAACDAVHELGRSDQGRKCFGRFPYNRSVGARDGAHGGSLGDTGEIFKRLYDECVAPVYAFCGRRLGALSGAAEDVTADIFTVVWRNIDKVPPAPECRTFIYGIAYRQVRKQQQRSWARSRLQRRLEAEWAVVSTVQPVWAPSSVPRDRVHRAIDALPEGERRRAPARRVGRPQPRRGRPGPGLLRQRGGAPALQGPGADPAAAHR